VKEKFYVDTPTKPTYREQKSSGKRGIFGQKGEDWMGSRVRPLLEIRAVAVGL
jgi:hypothetical protein